MVIGDYVVNTGTATRTILGVSAAIGDVVCSTSATAGTAAGSIRGATGATGIKGDTGVTGPAGAAGVKGVAFYGWNTASNLTNISSITGMATGDYVVNTGTATRTILGVSTDIGGIVCSTSATAGTATGNIRGPAGATGSTGSTGNTGATGAAGAAGAKGVAIYGWNTASNLTNISSITGMAVGDFVVNTGTATRTILGVSTAVGGVVCSTSATAGTAAGSIRGATGETGNTGAAGAAGAKGIAFYGWSTASNLTNISSISGMAIGDYVVNTGTATRTMLGVSTVIGGIIRSTSATAGTASGNIRGAAGDLGYTAPTSGPLSGMNLTQAIAYINQLLNGQHKDITLDVNTIKVPLS